MNECTGCMHAGINCFLMHGWMIGMDHYVVNICQIIVHFYNSRSKHNKRYKTQIDVTRLT